MTAALPVATDRHSNNGQLAEDWKKWKIPIILLYYGLCSSTLIVINKVAVHSLPAPVFILALQLLFAAFAVKGSAIAGFLEAEGLQWSIIKPFSLIVVAFLGTLFSNIMVLMHSNVETFITFRSSTPLVLSVCDYLFLGRELPGLRSLMSLVLLVGSCAGYALFDQGFKVQTYSWLLVWYVFFSFEACYVKFVCDNVKMSNWGRVYATNLMSGVCLLLYFPWCTSEHDILRSTDWSAYRMVVLALSCLVGVGMSHAGYLMRSNVSATAGVVVGVVCKIGSVLINLVIWDQHASAVQLAFLSLGLLGGSMFKQAPLRQQQQPGPVVSAYAEEKYPLTATVIATAIDPNSLSREASDDSNSGVCVLTPPSDLRKGTITRQSAHSGLSSL